MAPQSAQSLSHSKPCTLCHTPRDVLIRCQVDASGAWHLICPGACWRRVSGGVVDGDGAPEHAHYRYGGMWKNKHEAVSAKRPKKARATGEAEAQEGTEEGPREAVPEWRDTAVKYTKNDRVRFEGAVWICRKSHVSQEGKTPAGSVAQWKEAVALQEDAD